MPLPENNPAISFDPWPNNDFQQAERKQKRRNNSDKVYKHEWKPTKGPEPTKIERSYLNHTLI